MRDLQPTHITLHRLLKKIVHPKLKWCHYVFTLMSKKLFWDNRIFIIRQTFPLRLCFDLLFDCCKSPLTSSCHVTTEGKVNEFNAFIPSKFIPDHVHSPTMTNATAQQLSQHMTHKRTIRSVAVKGVLTLSYTFGSYTFEASLTFFWFSFYDLAGSVYDSPLPIVLFIVWRTAAQQWTQLKILLWF